MRRIVTAGALTATGLVLLMSYPTSTGAGAPASTGGAVAASASPGSTTGLGAERTPSGTYTGSVARTRWGNVQVEITVDGGEVVDATAVDYPSGNGTDQRINAYAVPILEAETVRAGSAHIDAVSGATVTSMGYIESLQSALDEAGL